ncbi:acyltransferase family protein [Pelagimonas varians]|uniref:O-acetyltransferase OatA n=1 Tax=Pelagimonas varians TaxID=696760 RepID=A0A238KLG6_9RHOB|nr:acyltransferase family protein [Pelagimonas varians]PYG29513.1 peptidoglycan/LPS O-acetylase OafA/YrhL [Pelagimonas varians]SMX42912.1 O-acetyltransferase OatA [Pelagimonas varians]
MMHTSHGLPYRRDIDGVRAFAVLSVVLYHFGIPLRGGFVGVDIFFVISGFLIGGLLWREYDHTGRIWLVNFYVRRFRRLAPAFFVMVFLTGALAWAILLPFEFREYGKATIAATVYLSNVLFFRQAGYFDAASEDKPLLHTWSLAVEEQFYIFLPLLILLLARSRHALMAAMIGCWILSLAACIVMTPSHPMAAFYLFPFRAWEMLSGVLLAIWGYQTQRKWRGYAALSWLGMLLLVLSVVLIPAGPLFPGLLALVPVVGTVLVLANGTGQNPVNKLLGHPWVVFFGLISYSLYLWHWPIFTLSTYLRGGEVGVLESIAWMVVSVGIAWLSWRFVESPVRRARQLSGAVVLGAVAIASIGTLAVSGWIFKTDGVPDRFGSTARPHITATGDFLQDWSRCYISDEVPLDGLEVCPIGPDGAPKVLIWGDSHVRAFKEGLDLAAHEADVPGIIIWRAGCPPLFGLRKVENSATPVQSTACAQANLQIRQSFGRLQSLETVLLIGRWAYYVAGTGVGLDVHNSISIHPTDGAARLNLSQPQLLSSAARETTSFLKGWFPTVHVLRQPPEIALYDARIAARETAHAGLPLAAKPITKTDMPRNQMTVRAAMADAPWLPLADTQGIAWIDSWPQFCNDQKCSALHDGVGQYFDNNHITNSAALRVRHLFEPVFSSVNQHSTNIGTASE